jgi:hypothetical protein
VGSGGIASPFLTSVLDGGELLALRPSQFIPGETDSDTHWRADGVDPVVDLDAVEKSLLPMQRIDTRPSSPCPVAMPTQLLAEM